MVCRWVGLSCCLLLHCPLVVARLMFLIAICVWGGVTYIVHYFPIFHTPRLVGSPTPTHLGDTKCTIMSHFPLLFECEHVHVCGCVCVCV